MIVKDYSQTNWRPSFYALFYPEFRLIALEHGYALALHGSFGKDMDIIAVPWIDEPKPHDEMVFKMCEAVGGRMHDVHLPRPNEKPHGRMVYTISIASDRYIDVSVMPTLK